MSDRRLILRVFDIHAYDQYNSCVVRGGNKCERFDDRDEIRQ